ncbi:hypothetical protein L0668_07795 [Paraglaciecola aquimarina]|uniref:Uncharacterized protein n=1 Tax=Paraglaciecola algarum TaxID=3050085 RepID=A0ABS9D514_9ALTE|nr:hypothetical protein [Paraglaciecola sp. G1-23]MCF2948005.1 hypothetical protein [Paraglaciecola sp. G1-23]
MRFVLFGLIALCSSNVFADIKFSGFNMSDTFYENLNISPKAFEQWRLADICPKSTGRSYFEVRSAVKSALSGKLEMMQGIDEYGYLSDLIESVLPQVEKPELYQYENLYCMLSHYTQTDVQAFLVNQQESEEYQKLSVKKRSNYQNLIANHTKLVAPYFDKLNLPKLLELNFNMVPAFGTLIELELVQILHDQTPVKMQKIIDFYTQQWQPKSVDLDDSFADDGWIYYLFKFNDPKQKCRVKFDHSEEALDSFPRLEVRCKNYNDSVTATDKNQHIMQHSSFAQELLNAAKQEHARRVTEKNKLDVGVVL